MDHILYSSICKSEHKTSKSSIITNLDPFKQPEDEDATLTTSALRPESIKEIDIEHTILGPTPSSQSGPLMKEEEEELSQQQLEDFGHALDMNVVQKDSGIKRVTLDTFNNTQFILSQEIFERHEVPTLQSLQPPVTPLEDDNHLHMYKGKTLLNVPLSGGNSPYISSDSLAVESGISSICSRDDLSYAHHESPQPRFNWSECILEDGGIGVLDGANYES